MIHKRGMSQLHLVTASSLQKTYFPTFQSKQRVFSFHQGLFAFFLGLALERRECTSQKLVPVIIALYGRQPCSGMECKYAVSTHLDNRGVHWLRLGYPDVVLHGVEHGYVVVHVCYTHVYCGARTLGWVPLKRASSVFSEAITSGGCSSET